MLSHNFFRVFVAVANTENISIAASSLSYTQGAVSHVLSRAEAELGFKLFQRTQRGVVLTEDGRNLLPYAKKIVNNLEQADSAIAAIQGLDFGHIKIGAYASVSQQFLPELIVSFTRDYPNITIEIVESFQHKLHNQCLDGSIDLAFTSIENGFGIDFIPLINDPYVAVFQKGTQVELDANGGFPLNRFSELNFIMPMEDSKLDPDYVYSFGSLLPKFNTRISSLDYISIMCMVRAGLGCSMLPRMITPDYEDRLDIYPITPSKSRTLGIALKSISSASITTMKFIEYTKSYVSVPLNSYLKDKGFTLAT